MDISDIIQQIIMWIFQRIELVLIISVTLGVTYVSWQDGYERGKKAGSKEGREEGYKDGFIKGIMHDIQAKALPDTNDQFIKAAQQRLIEQRDRNRPPTTGS
ncbi:hypothetical protein [Thiofilum flexile]|uniref:hypothetical protein n=1 Tax=Thiofilum flexile TaxID=125627 RepID=UPI0003701E38|nr:hypothetical protein [Thiofilum flexile]